MTCAENTQRLSASAPPAWNSGVAARGRLHLPASFYSHFHFDVDLRQAPLRSCCTRCNTSTPLWLRSWATQSSFFQGSWIALISTANMRLMPTVLHRRPPSLVEQNILKSSHHFAETWTFARRLGFLLGISSQSIHKDAALH